MNTHLISEFKQLLQYYKSIDDKNSSFKVKSTRNTLRLLESLNFEVNNSDQLKGISGVGNKTLEKINEILVNGSLNLPSDKSLKDQTLKKSIDLKINNLLRISGKDPKGTKIN